MDTNLNFNNAECMRDTYDIGKTIVHNVCNCTVTEVPWGMLDWLSTIVIPVCSFVLLFLLVRLAFKLVNA